MKALYAKVLGWGQLGITVLDQTMQAHGGPGRVHWLPILTSTLVAVAIHFSSSTDGIK